MSENHQRFLEHLKESEPVRWLVAQWLVRCGYIVSLKPVRYAGDASQWKDFVDDGDLVVEMRIEVKGRTYDFTSREDFPFKDGVIVCARHSYDDAKRKPVCYISVNRARTHVAVVAASTYSSWTVKRFRDCRYGESYEQDCYVAPLDVVKFYSAGELSLNNVSDQPTKE